MFAAFHWYSSCPLLFLLLIFITDCPFSCCYSSIKMIGNLAEKTLSRIANKQLIHSAGYINGKWSQAMQDKGTFDVRNPANGKLILQLPRMVHKDLLQSYISMYTLYSKRLYDQGVADAVETIEFSNQAFQTWKTTTARERSNLLSKLAQVGTLLHFLMPIIPIC